MKRERPADRPDPRDPRRVWARLLRRPARPLRHPAARELAAWAAAVTHEETFAAWRDSHPEGGGL